MAETAEAGISYTAKDDHGNLTTLRGDTSEGFKANALGLLGQEDGQALVDHVAAVFRKVVHPAVRVISAGGANGGYNAEQQAVENVVRAFPGSTVGQPLPQPGHEPAQQLDANGYPRNPQKGQVFNHPTDGPKVYLTGKAGPNAKNPGRDYAFWGDVRN